MRAVKLTANTKMIVEKVESKNPPAGHVKIRPEVVGICSSDLPRIFQNGAYHYPLVIGHEIAARVEALGSGVDSFAIGDRVVVFPLLPCRNCEFCQSGNYPQCLKYSYLGSREDGGLQDSLVVPLWNLLKIPDDISNQQAATLEPMAVMINAFEKSELLKSLQTPQVLIIGAGFLGLILADISRHLNPKAAIHIVDRNEFKLRLCPKGVTTHCLPSTKDFEKFFLERQGHFDVVFEVTGVGDLMTASLQVVKPKGELILVGNPDSSVTISQKMMSSILRKEMKILGVWNSQYNPALPSDNWRAAFELIRKGLSPARFVSQYIGLEEVPEMLTRLFNRRLNGEQIIKLSVLIQK
jgi:L-iditol 2-dehydrogenase